MTEKEEIEKYYQWLYKPKSPFEGDRMSIINYLIKKFNYKTYKDGVDPMKNDYVNYNFTSDEFFELISNEYDIIFIDGLHHDNQVYKDIINSLNHLSDNGTIVCHDMNPIFEICQRKVPIVETWNGDCWKAFARLRSEKKDLDMFTVDVDFGVGIIRKGYQNTIAIPDELNYDFLNNNRKNIMNLITINDFYNIWK